MKYQEIKDMNVKDLLAKKAEISKGLFDAKMKNSMGQLGNPLQIRGLRRDLARVETAIHKFRREAQ